MNLCFNARGILKAHRKVPRDFKVLFVLLGAYDSLLDPGLSQEAAEQAWPLIYILDRN